MNEFTKEELEMLLEGLLWRDATILPIDRPEKLKCKIQSMIDNYCDHDWDNPCCGCPDSSAYCTKCDKKVYE